MSNSWKKALRDFWQERTRTALVVLAIAMGIAGFAAVMSSYAILTRSLNEGYLATNPASFTVVTDRADEALLQTILADPEISDAEARRSISGRVKTGPGRWRPLVLFVVNDYANIRVSTLVHETGAWPPAPGEILIERDAFQVAKAKIGDVLTLKTADGPDRQLRISGGVHDVGQAQARMENVVYGYIVADTLSLLGEEKYLNQIKVLVAKDRFNEAHIRAVAERIRGVVEEAGHPVRRIDIPKPGKHPHADLTGMFMLAMSSFGLFVLLLSAILVVNLLMGLMASQVRQIGVMKAIGGSRAQIARIYFGQALLLGMAAIVVGVPLGLAGARLLCRYMSYFLNFDVTSYAVPLWVFLLVALVGLVVPLLAAAYPVWKGSGVSVREALSDFGVSAFGASSLDRFLANVGGLARPLLLSIRNSFRKRTRLALTLLTLTAGGLFFMLALNVRASMINTLDQLFAANSADLSVGFTGLQDWSRIERVTNNTAGITHAEGWISGEGVFVDGSAANATSAKSPEKFIVFGVPAPSPMLKSDIGAGRALDARDVSSLVMNSSLAAKYPNVKVGDDVTLRISGEDIPFRVVGLARESFSPAIAYIPMNFYRSRGKDGQANIAKIVTQGKDADSIDAIKTALDKNLEAEGLRATSMLTKADSRYGFDQHMLMIYIFLVVMSAVIAFVGGLGLSTSMSLNVLERRREMGILRAIGATPARICTIIATEGAVVGVMAWLIAGVIAWPLSKWLGNFIASAMFRTDLYFKFEWTGLLTWLAVSLALGLAASVLPAWHAARQPVREALSYE